MLDKLTKKERSQLMAKVKSKNTTPEIIVRKFLFKKGYRYRINVKTIIGKPDIVLRKYNTVIFVNGCFWHGHNCKSGRNVPKSNINYWESKINKNKIRDRENYEELKNLNWNIVIIWECSLKVKIREQTLLKLSYYLNEILLNNYKQKEILIC